jgi:hypothetical protein
MRPGGYSVWSVCYRIFKEIRPIDATDCKFVVSSALHELLNGVNYGDPRHLPDT